MSQYSRLRNYNLSWNYKPTVKKNRNIKLLENLLNELEIKLNFLTQNTSNSASSVNNANSENNDSNVARVSNTNNVSHVSNEMVNVNNCKDKINMENKTNTKAAASILYSSVVVRPSDTPSNIPSNTVAPIFSTIIPLADNPIIEQTPKSTWKFTPDSKGIIINKTGLYKITYDVGSIVGLNTIPQISNNIQFTNRFYMSNNLKPILGSRAVHGNISIFENFNFDKENKSISKKSKNSTETTFSNTNLIPTTIFKSFMVHLNNNAVLRLHSDVTIKSPTAETAPKPPPDLFYINIGTQEGAIECTVNIEEVTQ